MSSVNKRTILLLIWLAILGGLFFAITHLNIMSAPKTSQDQTPPPDPVAVLQNHWSQIAAHAAGPPLGAANAPYTVVEFGDFQCPQCGKMRPVLEKLIAQAGGQANLLFVPRPLPMIHKWAIPSVEAALVAAAQGKFWPMYNTLYENQENLEPGYYSDYAAKVGLNVAKFNAAMSSHQFKPQVTADQQFDDTISIEETPTALLRDNASGKITVFIGASNTYPGSNPNYQGIEQLAANPPWKTSTKK